MPIDPKDITWDEEPAPKSESNAPPSNIQWDEEPDPYIEAASGFGRGLAKGVAGLAGLPGEIQSLARKAEPYLGIKTPEKPLIQLPTGAEVTEAAKPYVSALSEESKTLPGKYGETIGEFAVMPGSGKTAKEVLARTVLPAVGSETAGQLTEGTALEPYARFAGSLLTTPKIGGAPKMAETLEAANRIGVDVPYYAATEASLPKGLAQISKAMPFGGGSVPASAEKAIGQLGEAATRLHTGLGAAGPAQAGSVARNAMTDWIKGRSKTMLNDAYDAVDRHINPQITTPLSTLSGQVQTIMDRRSAAGLAPDSPTIKMVYDAATRPEGLTYEGVKTLRTHVGEMLDTGILPADTSKAELKQLYGALTEDLGASVKSAGGNRAMELFNRANSMNKAVAERRENLAKIVGMKGDVNPEEVLGRIERMAQAGTKGDINRLVMARKSIPPQDWEHVTAGVVERLGRDTRGDFSPTRFLSGFAKMSDNGKDIMFGPMGNKTRDALEDIKTVSAKFDELNKYANVSKTAPVLGGMQFMGTLLAAPFYPKAAAAAAAAVPFNFVMSRVLSNPTTASAAANLQRALYDLKVGVGAPNVKEARVRAAYQAYLSAVNQVTGQKEKQSEERTERKAGGRIQKREYPAKRLTRLERAARKAFNEISNETKPLMDMPDEHIVQALDQVK